ncbi:MAG TPA: hypothetical protein VFX86_02465 [Candidatus Saccharimonadales bacterium]|nr:hypothetical protein [Candidatus Saccharimonadales bacterium]
MTRLTQPVVAAAKPELSRDGGFELARSDLDSQLEEQGFARVEGIHITGPESAIYAISRYLTDGSLREAMEDGLVSHEEASALTLNALRLVSNLHREGLKAHGNISPDSVLVDRAHETGALSGFRDALTDDRQLSSVLAIPEHPEGEGYTGAIDLSFTAPEVVMGGLPDVKSDVYSGAKTLSYALSGIRPQPSVRYFDDVIGNHLIPASAPDVTDLSTGLPEDTPSATVFALQQAMDPDPERRPSMGQLIEEINTGIYPLPAGQESPGYVSHN